MVFLGGCCGCFLVLVGVDDSMQSLLHCFRCFPNHQHTI